MILHMDMDAFFASVEQLDNPELRGKCVIVGGRSNRGVVSTCSYEARKYGVHSAMPMFQARRKCPHAVIVSSRMTRYKELSRKVMAVLGEFSPLVEPVSIDEAYVDITGCGRIFGTPEQIAAAIKQKIHKTVHLTCSIGIAPNKFLAKIASDLRKPDGVTIIGPEDVPDFVATLPIARVPGVGKVTRSQLEAMGVKTLGDVQKIPRKNLEKRFGKYGKRLNDLSMGVDNTPVVPWSPPKSISSEETLPRDTDDLALLKKYLLMQADDVGRQLRKHKVKARTVQLKIKHYDFKQVTRRLTLEAPTQSAETLYCTACRLLDDYRLSTPVRLIGLGSAGLVPESQPVQRGLFSTVSEPDTTWERVDRALDSITEKFGNNAVKRANIRDLKKRG